MKIEIRLISMKFQPYILHNTQEIFPEFQLFLLIVRGLKGGQKTPMKIQIRPILMKFKPYVLHTKEDFQIFSSFWGTKGG